METDTIFVYVLPIAIALTGIYFSFRTNILKDVTDCPVKPYSFASTQLMWWTLIIICTFCIYYGHHGEILELSNSSLILLGISLGTTTAAKLIDNTDLSTNTSRHQDQNHSESFITDILSDENGISVHRFQAFIFNAVFGLIFLNHFFNEGTFINFGQTELALMGISSAAYLGLKMTENKKDTPAPTTAAPVTTVTEPIATDPAPTTKDPV